MADQRPADDETRQLLHDLRVHQTALETQNEELRRVGAELDAAREHCLEAGMNDYVAKPVSPQALAEALDTWLPKGNAK